MPNADQFRSTLRRRSSKANAEGRTYLDVQAGDLHREIGGYPGPSHSMPTCCSVMKQEMRSGDQVLSGPPTRKGASLIIRYYLPR